MQRKSNFLSDYQKQRQGVAMLLAIAFLVITAVLMSIMLNMTAFTTKRTGDLYFQTQAELLAKSATEFTLLAISGHERNTTNGCLQQINIQYPAAGAQAIYDINVSIKYIGLAAIHASCAGTNSLIDAIVTPESNGTILLDTYVSTTDNVKLTEPVHFHRRTMQKP